MFGLVNCDASLLARQNTDPKLFFVRTLVKNWLWPIITFFGNYNYCFSIYLVIRDELRKYIVMNFS